MLRGPGRPLLAAACALLMGVLLGVLLGACGGTTYVDTSVGGKQPMDGAGWQGIDPIALDLPTAEPVMVPGNGPMMAADPGAPTVVNIWASFCEPCKDELPMLQSVADGRKIEVVGYTRDSKRANAVEALAAAGVAFANFMDPDAEIALALDGRVPINGIPTSVLVRDGKAIAVHIGPFPDKATILAALEIR